MNLRLNYSDECVASFAEIRSLAHDNKVDLVEELLTLMAREQHAPEV